MFVSKLTPEQWAEVRRAYEETAEPVAAIARRFGTTRAAIGTRVRKQAWTPRASGSDGGAQSRTPAAGNKSPDAVLAAATAALRRQVIRRLYKAIDTKLKLMELRMQKQMDDLEGNQEAAPVDGDKEMRDMGALVKTLGQMTEFEPDTDRAAAGRTASTSTDAQAIASEADAFRRALAERLEKLIPAS